VEPKEAAPIQTAGLRAASAIARDFGVSDVSIWRWQKRGWLQPGINISGRIYFSSEHIAEFKRRAEAGEFARGPVGAAKVSAGKKQKERNQITQS